MGRLVVSRLLILDGRGVLKEAAGMRGSKAHTIVVATEVDELPLDSMLELVEGLDGLCLWRMSLAEGVDGVQSSL